jgi:hypothetical protein
MSKVFIEESTLTSIGDAIREKNGTTDMIAPLNMATAITNLPSGGGTMVWENVAEMTTNGKYNISKYLEKHNQLIVFITYNSNVYAMIIENGVLSSPCYNDSGRIFTKATLSTPTFKLTDGILIVNGSKASQSYATVLWVE